MRTMRFIHLAFHVPEEMPFLLPEFQSVTGKTMVGTVVKPHICFAICSSLIDGAPRRGSNSRRPDQRPPCCSLARPAWGRHHDERADRAGDGHRREQLEQLGADCLDA